MEINNDYNNQGSNRGMNRGCEYDRAGIEKIVRETLNSKGGTGNSPMRLNCSEKLSKTIDAKIEDLKIITSMERENATLKLMNDIKEEIKSSIESAMSSSRDKTKWSMEIFKFAITVATLMGFTKYISS